MLQELYGNRADKAVLGDASASDRESSRLGDGVSLRSRPTATGLLIGAEDSVEKLRKKRMQEEYRRQLEEQLMGSKSAESKLRPGVPKRRMAAGREEGPSMSLEEERQREALAKRRQQEAFRANLDVQMQERQAMRGKSNPADRGPNAHEQQSYEYRNDSNFRGSDVSSYDPHARRQAGYGSYEDWEPYESSGRGGAAHPPYPPDAVGYRADGHRFERADTEPFKGFEAPVNKSPNLARQRMLEDVYGQKATVSSNEDSWRPGKPSAVEQERRRQSMEQQRALLEQQLQESSRMKNGTKAASNAAHLRTDFNAVIKNHFAQST